MTRTPPPPSAALAAYRAACHGRWKAIADMQAALGTQETARRLGISRQRVQQVVRQWKAAVAQEGE